MVVISLRRKCPSRGSTCGIRRTIFSFLPNDPVEVRICVLTQVVERVILRDYPTGEGDNPALKYIHGCGRT